MKHRFIISRCNSIMIILCLLFLNVFIACQDYVYGSCNPIPISIQPLSEQGQTYFEHAKRVPEERRHGFLAQIPSDSQDGYKLGEHGSFEVNFHQGTFTGKKTGSDYTVTGATDIFSIINFVPAVYEIICRCIDINGWYYRHDKAEYSENFLYAVDKARYKIYTQNSSDYYADAEYLKTKIYDFEVLIAACGNKKSSWRDACIEVRDKLIRSLKFIESQCNYTPEEQYKLTQQVLRYAIETVHKTTFKNKKDKQRLLTKYQEALAAEEKQYCTYQAAITAQKAREKELQKQRHIQTACIHQTVACIRR